MVPRPGFLGSSRKYLDYLRQSGATGRPSYLILFVTSACGGSCPHCFVGSRLGGTNDLSFDELARVSATAGSLGALLISGGEPFSRSDLAEIVSMFVENNGVRVCAIPTSGQDPDAVAGITARLVRAHPELHLSVAPSIDALEPLNDRLRYPGSYRGAREAIDRLLALRAKAPQLEVVVHTVLSRHNIHQLDALMEEVAGWGVDSHSVELIRDPRSLPPLPALREAHRRVLANRARYLGSPLERVGILGSLALAQRIKERSIAGRPFRCVAGRRVVVLDADGALRPCEPLPPVGNVRDFDCDLARAYDSLGPRAPSSCEACTHVCFINASIASQPVRWLELPFAYLRHRLEEVLRDD